MRGGSGFGVESGSGVESGRAVAGNRVVGVAAEVSAADVFSEEAVQPVPKTINRNRQIRLSERKRMRMNVAGFPGKPG